MELAEGFINRVNLLFRAQTSGQTHHPVAEIPIQRKVCRQGHQIIGLCHVLNLEPGRAHSDAQRFRFIAAGDSAAIVVAQNNDRPADQARPERSLAALLNDPNCY